MRSALWSPCPAPVCPSPPARRTPSPTVRSCYHVWHGAAPVPAELRAALVDRKQQIGQVEIITAITPYLSLPGILAGRDVVHWIDNTSACAALCKGYSGVPDSARLVHAFHAWAAGARVDAWFEYVPSAANIADEPSRDMSLSAGACLLAGVFESEAAPVRFPTLHALDDPAGWMRDAAVAAGCML